MSQDDRPSRAVLWIGVLCGIATSACSVGEAAPSHGAPAPLSVPAPHAIAEVSTVSEHLSARVVDPSALPAAELRAAMELERLRKTAEAEDAYRRAVRAAWVVDDVAVKTEALRRHATLIARLDAEGRFEEAERLLDQAIIEDQASGLYASLAADLDGQIYLLLLRGGAADLARIEPLLARRAEAEALAGRTRTAYQRFAGEVALADIVRNTRGDPETSRDWLTAMLADGTRGPSETFRLEYGVGTLSLDLLQASEAREAFSEARRALEATGFGPDARLYGRSIEYWKLCIDVWELEAQLLDLQAGGRPSADLMARIYGARDAVQKSDTLPLEDRTRAMWFASLVVAEAENQDGRSNEADLRALLDGGQTAELHLLASSLLAQHLSRQGEVEEAKALAEASLRQDFVEAFCTIPSLRHHWDVLRTMLDEGVVANSELIQCD